MDYIRRYVYGILIPSYTLFFPAYVCVRPRSSTVEFIIILFDNRLKEILLPVELFGSFIFCFIVLV